MGNVVIIEIISLSKKLIEVLAERDYLYDSTTLPTYIGPLARAYYFWTSNLKEEEKHQRKKLFGGFNDGLRPLKPYWWALDSDVKLLEIPITTVPIVKTPFHLSYLLYLSRFSLRLMSSYLKTALFLCRVTGTEPSFLLHPLDLLGRDQVQDLSFFPGMDLDGKQKSELFERVINELGRHFNLVSMNSYSELILQRDGMKIKKLKHLLDNPNGAIL